MTREAVLGVLSLILWALIVVVTLKYVLILLRADNNGEGGTLALMALAQRALGKGAGAVVLCGIISAALFYGDAMITPALSVLSAIEGLKVATPAFEHYDGAAHGRDPGRAVRRAIARHRGGSLLRPDHHRCGSSPSRFAGIIAVADDPGVLRRSIRSTACAFSPATAMIGLVTLGGGVPRRHRRRGALRRSRPFRPRADPDRLVRAGAAGARAELLRAGRARAVRIPRRSRTRSSCSIPIGRCCRWSCSRPSRPVIASQAVITGPIPSRQQAIQLGLLPRLENPPHLGAHYGQIFMPRVNFVLLVGVLLLVGLFRSSERARLGLWHRGDRHHGGHGDHGFRRDLEGVALVGAGRQRC